MKNDEVDAKTLPVNKSSILKPCEELRGCTYKEANTLKQSRFSCVLCNALQTLFRQCFQPVRPESFHAFLQYFKYIHCINCVKPCSENV